MLQSSKCKKCNKTNLHPENRHKAVNMYSVRMECKPVWILILLVYTKVSGGEFYDVSTSTGTKLDGDGEENLHSLTTDGDTEEGANHNDVKGLGWPEINFLAKLRQWHRQSQLVPAVKIPLEDQRPNDQPVEAGIDNGWRQLLLAGGVEVPANEIFGASAFDDDLSTVVRYLAQHRGQPVVMEPLKPDEELYTNDGQKRAAALRSTMARRSHSFTTNKERFSPSISVGALTNLGDFFQHLKHNLETLESKNLSNEQVKLLEGQNIISNLRKEFTEDYPKPAGSAAFLHAIRNYRPSHRIRALVSSVPDLYRGTNFHDPVYKLAGLGK